VEIFNGVYLTYDYINTKIDFISVLVRA